MKTNVIMGLSVLLLVVAATAAGYDDVVEQGWRGQVVPGSFQARINALKPGARLVLRGIEQGPIVIRTPGVTIEGQGQGIIDGQGRGSVVLIEADDVTLRGLTIQSSGQFNPHVDAGVAVSSAKGVRLEQLLIKDVLFGVDISASQDVELRRSELSSYLEMAPNNRGDAIRVWSSKDVLIEDNFWHDARDAVAWYSERVTFRRNHASRTRYSVHSMYSKSLLIEENRFEGNSVGIFIMYGQGTTVLNNRISRSAGVTGIGLGLKETSSVYAQGNAFIYCATGLLVDNSPWEPGTRNWFLENQLQFNDVGVLLANDRDNEFRRNRFESNRLDVDSEQRRKSPGLWRGNYWGDYEGFDRDADGIGDTPHIPRKYGDLLTGSHPSARYFTGSAVLVVVNLIERLVPLTEPIELLEDVEPHRISKSKQVSHDSN